MTTVSHVHYMATISVVRAHARISQERGRVRGQPYLPHIIIYKLIFLTQLKHPSSGMDWQVTLITRWQICIENYTLTLRAITWMAASISFTGTAIRATSFTLITRRFSYHLERHAPVPSAIPNRSMWSVLMIFYLFLNREKKSSKHRSTQYKIHKFMSNLRKHSPLLQFSMCQVKRWLKASQNFLDISSN